MLLVVALELMYRTSVEVQRIRREHADSVARAPGPDMTEAEARVDDALRAELFEQQGLNEQVRGHRAALEQLEARLGELDVRRSATPPPAPGEPAPDAAVAGVAVRLAALERQKAELVAEYRTRYDGIKAAFEARLERGDPEPLLLFYNAHRHTPFAPAAAFFAGERFYSNRRFADAERRYAEVLARFPDSEYAALARRRLAPLQTRTTYEDAARSSGPIPFYPYRMLTLSGEGADALLVEPAVATPAVTAAPTARSAAALPSGATARYVSAEGASGNRGTAASPWDLTSVLAGRQQIRPGTTVYLRGGIYRHEVRDWGHAGYMVSLAAGTPEAPVHIRPAPGERVTIDAGVTVRGARHVWIWDLELTISETARWNRVLDQAGSHPTGVPHPSGGLNILDAVGCKFINLIVHHNASTGIGFWRPAVDCELHACLIYQNGWIGPDRHHGPGIYTQNETGEKFITDCIFWGNYSTTIQAYGSANAHVDGFRIIGNIAYESFPTGGRARILVGGGRPSRDIVVKENLLHGVPLQIGYNAPHNEDCVVHDNVVIDAGLSIINYRRADERDNLVLARGARRPTEAQRVVVRPNKYDPQRAHVVLLNWRERRTVSVDLGSFLKAGDRFRLLSPLDFFGTPVLAGRYDGRTVTVPTGGAEFVVFILLRDT